MTAPPSRSDARSTRSVKSALMRLGGVGISYRDFDDSASGTSIGKHPRTSIGKHPRKTSAPSAILANCFIRSIRKDLNKSDQLLLFDFRDIRRTRKSNKCLIRFDQIFPN